jgi:hypothetical protein
VQIDWRVVLREAIVHALFFLPRRQSVALERRLRGREDLARLSRADCVVVSFPNSGRTWLRVLLARFYRARAGLDGVVLAELDRGVGDGSRRGRRVPRFFFTHDNYLRDCTGDGIAKSAYAGKRVILMVRDPADVAVSQYFQWKHRMRRRKMLINEYPLESDVPLFGYVMRPDGGLPRIIRFLNEWAQALPSLPSVLLVRYEDLRSDTARVLAEMLAFIGTPGDPAPVEDAIAFASLSTMRSLEDSGESLMRSGRLMVENDPNRYKARRAKVGGYRSDFSPDEIGEIDRLLDVTLSPVFGYRRSSPEDGVAATRTAPSFSD